MKIKHLIVTICISFCSFAIKGQTLEMFLNFDLNSSIHFKSLEALDRLSIEQDKLLYFNNKQWNVLTYKTKQVTIDKTYPTTLRDKSLYKFSGTNRKIVFGFDEIYFFDNNNKMTHIIRMPYEIVGITTINDNTCFCTRLDNDDIVVYQDKKMLCSHKVDGVHIRYMEFREAKNFLSAVVLGENYRQVTEYYYDSLKNKIYSKTFEDTDDGAYLVYSNEKFLYYFDGDNDITIKKRNQNKLENVKTFSLAKYFPFNAKSFSYFDEGSPNFIIREVNDKIYIFTIFNKRLYGYRLVE